MVKKNINEVSFVLTDLILIFDLEVLKMEEMREYKAESRKAILWLFVFAPLITLMVVIFVPQLSEGTAVFLQKDFFFVLVGLTASFMIPNVIRFVKEYKNINKNMTNDIIDSKISIKEMLLKASRVDISIDILFVIIGVIVWTGMVMLAPSIPNIYMVSGRQIASTIQVFSMYLILIMLLSIRSRGIKMKIIMKLTNALKEATEKAKNIHQDLDDE